MSEVLASMECAPAMWCAGELVIVSNNSGERFLGTIIDSKLEWVNHIGSLWLYDVWMGGRIISVFERRYGEFKIVQRVTEEMRSLWEARDVSSLEIW